MDKKKVFFLAMKLLHAIIAMALVVGAMVEFAQPPPFFDSFFDRSAGVPPPIEVFEKINPVIKTDGAQFHQLMDVPILFISLVYFGCAFYLRFDFLSLALTFMASLTFLMYFLINSWAKAFFEWRFFYSRSIGIFLQVCCFTMLGTMSVVMLMWRRKRLSFHLKSPFSIKVGGPVHVAWNLVGTFLLYFMCILMWISRSYQSYVCTEQAGDIAFLCQMTEQVACIPCSTCTNASFEVCAASTNSSGVSTAYCLSGIPYDKGFCIINYSTGYFTFVKLFAYIGGLFFFMRNFLNASMHYALLLVYSTSQWWKGNAAGRLEATWSSLSSRFSVSESTNLRSYFKSRVRRHSAPGTVTPPRMPIFRPQAHSPILEASREHDEEGADESTALIVGAQPSRYGADLSLAGAAATPGRSASSGYTLPSPCVQPPDMRPGTSREIGVLP